MRSMLGDFTIVRQCLGRNSHGPRIPLKAGKPEEGRGFLAVLPLPQPPTPQDEKRLSFLGFQGFLSGISFPFFCLCRRPRQRHSVLQFCDRDPPAAVHGELRESAWHGPSYVVITEKETRLLQIYKNWKVLLLHVNRFCSRIPCLQ